jgi:hypothetical protein
MSSSEHPHAMKEREVSSERVSEEKLAEVRGWCAERKAQKPWYGEGEDSPKMLTTCDFMISLIDELLALRSSVKTVGVKKLVDYLWQEFCELPDRSSPEDYPDMALVSLPELTAIIETYLERSAIEAPAAASEVTEELACPTSDGLVEAIYTSVEGHIRTIPLSYGIEPQLTNRLRSVIRIGIHAHNGSLTAALKGDRP